MMRVRQRQMRHEHEHEREKIFGIFISCDILYIMNKMMQVNC